MLLLIALLCSTLAGSAAAQSVDITVYPYSGDGPANLVSNALPLKPGALFDAANVRVMDGAAEVPLAAKVLARWPQDNSIRSVLLQFVASFSTASKAYTIQIGAARGTADRTLVPVTWDLPTRIFTLPAQYLSDSLVFWEQKPLGQTGFPAWDSKQVSSYSRIETVGTAACVRDDNYYDATTTTYQLYARTGELKYLVNARRWALHHRRDQIYLDGPNVGHPKCSGAYLNNTRYTFPQALISDYFMFGDEEDRRVSALVVDNFYMPHDPVFYYKAPNTRGWWTEREGAFSLIGTIAHYQGTNNSVYLNKVKERVTSLHKMQVDNGRRAWVHNLYDHDPSEGCSTSDWGSSPWMSGLMLEAIVEYHKLTGDPTARESILMALDDIKARYLARGSYAGVSFVYLGCPVYKDGVPDLDNMISHAFGYGYKLTGSQDYLKIGTDIFNTSVKYGVTASHKHYDQQFRSSGHFVAYVAGGGGVTPPPQPPPASSDTTPPAVTVNAVPAVVGGVITLTAGASDNVGVAGVQFLIDGSAWGAEDSAAPWSVEVNTDLLSSGTHTASARARDAAGNTGTSAGVSFIVDNGKPVVTITSPAAGATVSGTFTASATITDRNAITGVQFLVDNQPQGAELTSAPYTRSIDAAALASGNHTLSVVARDIAGNQGTASVAFTVQAVVTPPPPAPVVEISSVVSAAHYGSNLSCSPNALVTLFGNNMTSGASASGTIPLPRELAGVKVKADGVPLPLLWVAPSQINLQCPDGPPGQRFFLTVERDGQASAAVDVAQQYATPGIFTIDATGEGQGAILIGNTDKFVMRTTAGIPSRPAVPGDYISIFATGLGPLTVPVPPGEAAGGAESRVIAPVAVKIGGITSEVTYAGMAPGWVGLYQVNARVPANVPFGDTVPVAIGVTYPDGTVVSSNTVTISVQPAQ